MDVALFVLDSISSIDSGRYLCCTCQKLLQLIAVNLTLCFDKQTTRTHNYSSLWLVCVDHKLAVLVVYLSKLRVKFAAISCTVEPLYNRQVGQVLLSIMWRCLLNGGSICIMIILCTSAYYYYLLYGGVRYWEPVSVNRSSTVYSLKYLSETLVVWGYWSSTLLSRYELLFIHLHIRHFLNNYNFAEAKEK